MVGGAGERYEELESGWRSCREVRGAGERLEELACKSKALAMPAYTSSVRPHTTSLREAGTDHSTTTKLLQTNRSILIRAHLDDRKGSNERLPHASSSLGRFSL